MPHLLRRTAVLLTALATLLGVAAPAWAGVDGIDVSNWQHPDGHRLDWAQVKQSGKAFAFVKATEGPNGRRNGSWYTNPYFAADWAAAGYVGMVRGAYHYAEPGQPLVPDALAQARYFVSVTGTMRGPRDLPGVLDLETANGLSPSDLATWTKTWLDEVQRLTGRQPILYTYQNFWLNQMANTTAFRGYRLWFARYTSDPSQVVTPGGWSTWTFWQRSSSGSVPGITGAVDLDTYCCSPGNLAALANGAASSAAASNPFGSYDALRRWPGGVQVSGWAIDPDTQDPVTVHAYVDGRLVNAATANAPGPDVAAAYPGFGADHRFWTPLPLTAPGRHTVCLYAINTGYGTGNPGLGCRSVTVSNLPVGHVSITRSAAGVRVYGWAYDPDVVDPLTLDIYVDGHLVTNTVANLPRSDVARDYPGYGAQHGADTTLTVGPGPHKVCVWAINAGAGSANPNIGCATV